MPRAKPIHERPIHERVKAHVDAEGWSPVDLARETGWSYQRARRILEGSTKLDAVDMETLSRALKKPVAALYVDPEARAS